MFSIKDTKPVRWGFWSFWWNLQFICHYMTETTREEGNIHSMKWCGCQSKCPVFFPAWTLNPSMLVNGVKDKGHQSRVVRRKLRSPLRENASFRFGFETVKLQHKNTIWYQTDNTNTTWFMSLYYLFSVFLVMFGVKKGLSVLLFFCSSFRDYSMEDWVNEYWDFIKRV